VSFEELRFAWRDGDVSGARHRPPGDRRATLVFGHGAGGSMKQPYNVALADALAETSVETWRFNFPYSEAGRRAPDKQDKLEACYWGVAKTVAESSERLFLGGQSMGGRIATHIVAGGFPVAGLVLQSYPLHPPGKPERLRDAHLPRIGAPMLFISGTRDSFATGDLLERTIARLPTATLHRIEGADHSLGGGGRTRDDVIAEVVATISSWIDRG
jgi:uncharacterized protein